MGPSVDRTDTTLVAWPHAAVFDFDGLLVDSASCWRKAFKAALEATGRDLDAAQLQSLAGASVRRAALELNVSAADLRRQLSVAFVEAPPRPLVGAQEMISVLGATACIAIATNAPTEIVQRALATAGINGIELIVSAETPPHRDKPAPDVYAEACRALGVDPANAVAFDDSPVGVLAARRAGLFVVHVTSGDMSVCDADVRVDNLASPGLLQLLERRPSFHDPSIPQLERRGAR